MQVNFIFLQFHSYILVIKMVGVPGLEPGTSSLSGTRSNQLSYTPKLKCPTRPNQSGLSDLNIY